MDLHTICINTVTEMMITNVITCTLVLLKGMLSMPSGRRLGMGPYVPSSRDR